MGLFSKFSKIKLITMISSFVIGVTLIIIALFLNNNQKLDDKGDGEVENNPSPPTQELLGEDRVTAQNEIISVVEKYITDLSKIKEYLEKKGDKTISIKELKENLGVDTSEFENLKYGCDSRFTTIEFNEDYSEHVISLTCEALFKK